MPDALLFTNKNQNARSQRQNSSQDYRDRDVDQSHDSNKDQVNSEQEHSEVFSDIHGSFLRQNVAFACLKLPAAKSFTDSCLPPSQPAR
jgi:hypothetical protein